MAWLLGQAVILLQRRWHWWRFALASLAWIAAGARRDRPGGGPAPAHLRAPALLAVRRPPLRLRPTRHPHHRRPVPLGPGRHPGVAGRPGRAAGRLAVGVERRAGRRRGRVEPLRPPPPAHRPARPRPQDRPAGRPTRATTSSPRRRSGIALDGDLRSWRQGRYVVPPAQLRGKAMAVVGAPGAGKTITLLRLAYLAGRAGSQGLLRRLQGHRPHPGPGPDRRLPARQPQRPGRLLAGHGHGHVARHPGPGGQPPAGGRAVHRALLPAGRLRRPPPGPHRPRHAARRGQRRAAAPPGRRRAGRPLGRPAACSSRTSRPSATTSPAPGCATPTSSPPWPAPSTEGRWSYEDVDLAVLTVPTLLSKSEADAAMRVVLEDYGHYATGRKPREGEDALLVLDEFSRPRLRRGLAPSTWPSGSATSASRSSSPPNRVEGLGDHRQAPRLLASCAGGIVVHQCPDPERLLALAGMVRTLEHNWELDHYGPRGFAKARMGDRPRIDPEAVRQAQPGEAWVIQAGQSIHLRVLPPPAVAPAPVEPAATLPLADDTMPLPTVEEPAPGRDRGRRRPRRPESSAGLASGSAGGGSGRGGCPRRPGGRGWSGGPCPVGGGDEVTGGDRPRLRRRVRGPRPARGPAGCLLDGLPPGRRPRQGRFAVLADWPAAPLDPAVVQAARRHRSPGAGEEQRPTSRQEARTVADQHRDPHPRRHLLTHQPGRRSQPPTGPPPRPTPAAPRARGGQPWPTPTSPSPAT